jgi:dTMP kinase
MEYEVFGVPRPDLHVWLDVPPQTAVGLITGKGERDYLEGEEDIHEGDLDYLRATRRMYEHLAEVGQDWWEVSCAPEGGLLSEEEVTRLVWQGVSRILE